MGQEGKAEGAAFSSQEHGSAPADFCQLKGHWLRDLSHLHMETPIGIRCLSKLRDLGWEGAVQTD